MDSDDEMETLILASVPIISDLVLHTREPCHDGRLPRPAWVHELLCGNSNRIYRELRMERHVFLNLCDLIRSRAWLKDSRYIRIDEQVAIFLHIVGKGNSNREAQERFQRSGETISRFFKIVLTAMRLLASEKVRPTSTNDVPVEIAANPKYHPYFKDCIGAIDGTHISVIVPREDQSRYWNRKGHITQNVMCACSLDMKFTFVLAGWEGSANDCRVFEDAKQREEYQFPHPPPGKYYVVDSGYASQTGYLTPFKGERYHLQDYRGSGRPKTAKELFNYRHSSLRNVIERSFGVLKNRFKLLRKMPAFKLEDQSSIIIAYCGLHNYIQDEQHADKKFNKLSRDTTIVTDDLNPEHEDYVPIEPTQGLTSHRNRSREMNQLRIQIANQLAQDNGVAEI